MTEPTHRLFFALRPGPSAAGDIERAAALIKAGGRVRGRWVKPPKYHMTVQFLGNHTGRPADVIEKARTAAAQVRMTPFDVVLDRVATFGGHRRSSPCLLRCTPDSDNSVLALRSALGEALVGAGLARLLEDRFTPHVTIAYVDQHLAQPIAVEPIAWRADEFALLESRIGDSRHEVLDRWPLLR